MGRLDFSKLFEEFLQFLLGSLSVEIADEKICENTCDRAFLFFLVHSNGKCGAAKLGGVVHGLNRLVCISCAFELHIGKPFGCRVIVVINLARKNFSKSSKYGSNLVLSGILV